MALKLCMCWYWQLSNVTNVSQVSRAGRLALQAEWQHQDTLMLQLQKNSNNDRRNDNPVAEIGALLKQPLAT